MKVRRQALILELLGKEPVRNQEQLRRGLRALGVKRASDGAYQRAAMPGPPAGSTVSGFSRAVTAFVTGVDRVQQLVVLRTGP
jgi:arginine repressor